MVTSAVFLVRYFADYGARSRNVRRDVRLLKGCYRYRLGERHERGHKSKDASCASEKLSEAEVRWRCVARGVCAQFRETFFRRWEGFRQCGETFVQTGKAVGESDKNARLNQGVDRRNRKTGGESCGLQTFEPAHENVDASKQSGSPSRRRVGEICAVPIRFSEICFDEICFDQVRFSEICSGEICSSEIIVGFDGETGFLGSYVGQVRISEGRCFCLGGHDEARQVTWPSWRRSESLRRVGGVDRQISRSNDRQICRSCDPGGDCHTACSRKGLACGYGDRHGFRQLDTNRRS